jgi:hypothetical protein
MTETVYIGMAYHFDKRGVYTRKVGEEKQDAKDAVLEAMSERIPLTVHNLQWEGRICERNGWKFVVKEKRLYGERND